MRWLGCSPARRLARAAQGAPPPPRRPPDPVPLRWRPGRCGPRRGRGGWGRGTLPPQHPLPHRRRRCRSRPWREGGPGRPGRRRAMPRRRQLRPAARTPRRGAAPPPPPVARTARWTRLAPRPPGTLSTARQTCVCALRRRMPQRPLHWAPPLGRPPASAPPRR